MAEIVCNECKATVSDLSGYCPECGYPFDADGTLQGSDADVNPERNQEIPLGTLSLEPVKRELGSLKLEISGLSGAFGDLRQSFDMQTSKSAENTLKLLAEVNGKLDTIISANLSREKEAQADAQKKQSSSSQKIAGSPSGMIEYMFYICVAQIVFVIVNLFLAAYIVTLLRD